MNPTSFNLVSLASSEPIYSPMPIPISLPSNALLSIGGFDPRQGSTQFTSTPFALHANPTSSGLNSLDALIPNLGAIAPSASFLGGSVPQFASFSTNSAGANLYSSVLTQGNPTQLNTDYFPSLAVSVGQYSASANSLAANASISSAPSNVLFDASTTLPNTLPQFSPPTLEQLVQQSAPSNSTPEATVPVSSARTRTDSHSSTTHHRSSGSTSSGNPPLPPVPPSESAVSVLFAHVRRGTCSFNTLADDFIDRFKSNRDLAILDLLQLFVSASGCTGQLASVAEALKQPPAELLQALADSFPSAAPSGEDMPTGSSGELLYPLVTPGHYYRKLRHNLAEFIHTLVRQCQNSLLYDQFLTERLLNFLIAMSDSSIRAFRHTGTYSALKLQSALVEILSNLLNSLESTTRQFEQERSKLQTMQQQVAAERQREQVQTRGSSSRLQGNQTVSSARLDSLQSKKIELQANVDDLKTMTSQLFRNIFVQRYRDVVSDIRSLCMEEIGQWFRRLPSVYLDDSYLKYVGWTLYDRVGEVRLRCLATLAPLFDFESSSEPIATGRMELFTQRFRDRLVEMVQDKDIQVAVSAVKLLCTIVRRNETALTDKNCEQLYELVYGTNRQLAQAAGEFVCLKLLPSAATSDSSEPGDIQPPPSPAFSEGPLSPGAARQNVQRTVTLRSQLRDLVAFFMRSQLHTHAAYLVDSLWEHAPILRNWKVMTDLLLIDPEQLAFSDEPLSDREEFCLIEVMCCAVRQASTGEAPVARAPPPSAASTSAAAAGDAAGTTSKRALKAEMGKILEERTRLTEHLIPLLPSLISKFSDDESKLVNLVQVPHYMQIDLYIQSRSERHLDSLFRVVQEVLEKRLEQDVFIQVGRIFELFTTAREALSQTEPGTVAAGATPANEFPLAAKYRVLLASVVERLFERLKVAFNQFFTNEANTAASEEMALALAVSLRKLLAFSEFIDLSKWAPPLWEHCTRAISLSLKDPEKFFEPDIIVPALHLSSQLLVWQLHNLESASAAAAVDRAAGSDVKDEEGGSEALLTPQIRNEIRLLSQRIRELVELLTQILRFEFKDVMYEGFLVICDMAQLFSPHLITPASGAVSPIAEHLKPVVLDLRTDRELQTLLQEKLVQLVFDPKVLVDSAPPENADEDDQNVKIDDLHLRRSLLAGYCKLLVFGALPVRAALPVFKNCVQFLNDYGDITRLTINRTKELDKVEFGYAVISAIIHQFRELQLRTVGESAPLDKTSTGWQLLHDTARRFALSVGPELSRTREAVAKIHVTGISYILDRLPKDLEELRTATSTVANAPNVLQLFEIIQEFSHRIIRHDKLPMLQHFEGELSKRDIKLFDFADIEAWQPVHSYHQSLMRDLNLPGRPDSFSAAASAPKKPKGRPRKPKPEQSVPAATSDEQSATFDESKPPTEGVPGEEVPPTFEPPNDVTSGEKPVVRKRRRGGGPGSRGGTGRGRGRGRGALVSSEVEAPEQTAAAETEASSETGDEPPISRPRLTARLKLRPAARSRSSSSASTESPEDEEPEHSPAAEPDDVQPQESTTDSSSIVAEEPEPSATATSSTSINSSPDNAAAGDKAQDDNAESVSGEAEEARNIIAPCLISRSGRHIVPNPKFFN